MNFHYSTLLHLPFILESEVLQASRRDAHGAHAAGLLWFSTNLVMERTALKKNAIPVRFKSQSAPVCDWRTVTKAVGFSTAVMRRLERSGRAMGGLPHQWRALIGDLPLSAVDRIELLNEGAWQEVDRDALMVSRVSDDALRLDGPGGLVAVVARQKTAEGYFAYATNQALCNPGNLVSTVYLETG